MGFAESGDEVLLHLEDFVHARYLEVEDLDHLLDNRSARGSAGEACSRSPPGRVRNLSHSH